VNDVITVEGGGFVQLTIIAKYDNFYIANGAASELAEYGIPAGHINILADSRKEKIFFHEGPGPSAIVVADSLPDEQGTGAKIGRVIGMAAGALLGAAVNSLTPVPVVPGVPGYLPGLIAGILIGSLVGIVAGRLLGSLFGLGIPTEEAETYAECVRQGQALVTVQAETYMTGLLYEILGRYRPTEIYHLTGQPGLLT
jgi:hypothetical protein